MNRVKGKVCIVTGAALGIGRACAIRLAEEGAHVALFDVLTTPRPRHWPTSCAAAASTPRYWHVRRRQRSRGRRPRSTRSPATSAALDVLVNNAGIAGANKPTHELTEAEWDRVQAINVKGVFFCTKHAIPHLRRAGGGSIINLSSIYGLVGAPDVPPYHASKGAVRLMSKTDALIYAPDRIRVNSIHPGFIWTPMVEHHLRDAACSDLEAGRRDLAALHPLGHMGEPDDIAWGVVYLASRRSQVRHRLANW